MNEKYRPFLEKLSREELIECVNKEKKKEITGELVKKKTEKLQTEVVGIIFEMAQCIYYDIPYNGPPFKYDISISRRIAQTLKNSKIQLIDFLPLREGITWVHTAQRQARYDFTSSDGYNMYHSKSNKNDSNKMQAAEQIGQGSMNKWKEFFQLPITYNLTQVKYWIYNNIKEVILLNYRYLFDKPICYYCNDKYYCEWITAKPDLFIDKTKLGFAGNKKLEDWNNSLTIKYNDISIAEIQTHSSSRHNIVFRFNFKKNKKSGIFSAFPDNFQITKIF